MSEGTDVRKVAAICETCGTAYVATRAPGGDVRPIGHPSGCPCGSSDFHVLTDTEPSDSDGSDIG